MSYHCAPSQKNAVLPLKTDMGSQKNFLQSVVCQISCYWLMPYTLRKSYPLWALYFTA